MRRPSLVPVQPQWPFVESFQQQYKYDYLGKLFTFFFVMFGVDSVVKEHSNLSNEAKSWEKTKLKAHQTAELTASSASMGFFGINCTTIMIIYVNE